MILNNLEERKKLRKEVEKELENVKEGERIHLDKKILELLLFENVYIPIKNNGRRLIKTIVWSGPFLQKIDLKEVSFDNVIWDMDTLYSCIKDDEALEDIKKKTDGIYEIDLSNTNATIDFSKSVNPYGSSFAAYKCNFENVDLSSNTLFNPFIGDCNFENTGIKIKVEKKYSDSKVYEDDFGIIRCNMKGTDFSECTIDLDIFYGLLSDTNFAGTGLKILFVPDGDEVNEYIGEEIKKGYFDGCYINGVLIKSKEQQQEIAKQLKDALDNKAFEYDTVMNDIKEQINRRK